MEWPTSFNASDGSLSRPRSEPVDSAAMGEIRVRRVPTAELRPAEVEAIRAILWAAFEDDEEGFTEDDWEHGLGGIHVVAELDGRIVAHGSVVPRDIHAGGRPLATGYVESVATDPGLQRTGLGTAVMREIGAIIRDRYELGLLGSGEHGFYERLGWRTWRGPSSVRTPNGRLERTPTDDGFLMALATPTSPRLDYFAPISCDWRPGDVW
jgi:aminoglycoside 2'-N-acetyltransferase I